jgi:hypothetical protein
VPVLTAQPSRWVTAAAKTVMAASRSLWLGAAGMTAGFVGGLLGGLEIGSTRTIVETALWALLYTSLAAVLGLSVGILVRHSSASLSGVLVWGLVLENLLTVFAPESASRFLPFVADNNLLGIVGTGAFAVDAARRGAQSGRASLGGRTNTGSPRGCGTSVMPPFPPPSRGAAARRRPPSACYECPEVLARPRSQQAQRALATRTT